MLGCIVAKELNSVYFNDKWDTVKKQNPQQISLQKVTVRIDKYLLFYIFRRADRLTMCGICNSPRIRFNQSDSLE